MTKARLQWAVIGLTGFTALVHLFLGLTNLSGPIQTLGIMWLLNGIGYLVLLGGVTGQTPVLKNNKPLAHYALMTYAGITIVAYFLVSGVLRGEPLGWLGPIDKLAEVLLIMATYLHLNPTSSSTE